MSSWTLSLKDRLHETRIVLRTLMNFLNRQVQVRDLDKYSIDSIIIGLSNDK
jgi:hypothetical protein